MMGGIAPIVASLLLGGLGQQQEEELREAARRGDLTEARALLEAGVDVNAGNRYDATALFFAADKGDREMVELLLEHGARVDVRDTFYRMSPLARALGKGHVEVVLLLLERGAPEADPVLVTGARENDERLVRAALSTKRVTRDGYDRALEIAKEEGAEAIVSIVEAYEPPARAPEATFHLTPEQLQRFVGGYQNDAERRTASVELTGEELVLRAEGEAIALQPTGEQRFELADGGGEVVFGGRGGMIENMVVRRGDDSTVFRPIDEAESREPAPASAPEEARAADLPRAERSAPAPWPAFRGPNRSGIADGQGVPLEWDATTGKNVRWKTTIPGFSVSSPIIWGDRVFVLTAVSSAGDATFRTGLYGDVTPVDDLSEHRWILYALDKSDGRMLWERELHRGVPGTKRHTKSSQANATPATDGKHVVTVLGPAGLVFCHDVEGNLRWKKDIGVLNAGWFYDPDYQWGHASSPIVYDDLVILQADVHNGSFLAAYDVESGNEVWRVPRDEEIPTFSTPAVYRREAGDELVTNGTVIRGYDPKTGKLLWHLGPNSEIPIGAPVVNEHLIYVTAGYPPIRPIYAIRPGSRGDLALPEGVEKSEALAWSKDRGGTYIPSPLVYRGYFYTNANNGRLTCYDAETGERVYRARIGGVGGSYAASPIAADGRLYFTNEEGETFVVKAGPEYELLAKNTVDGVVLSTPAASDGILVIRTLEYVYGIGE